MAKPCRYDAFDILASNIILAKNLLKQRFRQCGLFDPLVGQAFGQYLPVIGVTHYNFGSSE